MLKTSAPFPQPGARALLTVDGEILTVRIIQKNANGTLLVTGKRMLADGRTPHHFNRSCWPWDLVPTTESAKGMTARDALRSTPPGEVAAALFAAIGIGTLLFATHIFDPSPQSYPAPDQVEVTQ